MMRQIDFTQIAGAETDPLTWYDRLPGDDVRVSGIPDGEDCAQLLDALLARPQPDDVRRIDLLTARLLDSPPSVSDERPWRELAARLSALMCRQLAAGGDRALRMRAQRLNYCIQACVDRSHGDDAASVALDELTLSGSKPWDCIERDGERWWLTSDRENVHRDGRRGRASFTRGLPTQLDMLPDGRLSIGSIYTDGAWLTDGDDWLHIDHARPVVMAFEHSGELHILDNGGTVWRWPSRSPVLQAPCRQLHFARLFGTTLYCLDNCDFGHVTRLDLASGQAARVATAPVQVCNDIVEADDVVYLIDKQQGSVFKFTRDFEYIERRLAFGRAPRHLLDPVSLRLSDGKLRVVSWLTGRLTSLSTF
ncbi:MAG: hypothetical protein DI561_11170 [Thauera sp.]|jgi:hypothetical protein|nr:MAG: hypothetical protein DI561_11170 [Thauera sp.]